MYICVLGGSGEQKPEELNKKALTIIQRVRDKLTGTIYHIFSYIHCVCTISYSTIVYSRDHKGVGMAHEITSPKKQPQFPLMTMRHYWLGKTKPKKAFRST